MLLAVVAGTDLAAQSWTQVSPPAPTPPARALHKLAYDQARDRTVLFGGWNFASLLGDTWEFDGVAWTNVTPAASPSARRGHSLCYDSARGRVILFGGDIIGTFLTDTWEYDGVVWQQIATPAAPTPRLYAGFAYDAGRRRTVLFGGWPDPSLPFPLADTWEYDGSQWSQASPAVSPPARSSPVLEYHAARGTLVMFGGFDVQAVLHVGTISVSGLPLGDTWTYDGTTWTPVTGSAPPPRDFHSSAYDRIRGRMIVFGGRGFPIITSGGHGGGVTVPIYNDTWSFDGAVWTQDQAQGSAGAPTARFLADMAFDSARGRTLLFGGGDMQVTYGDTWEWSFADSASWTRYGPGCAGTSGTPGLDGAPGTLPVLGSVFPLQLSALPTQPGVTVVVLGFDLVRWNGLLLPVGLDPARAQCLLWLGPGAPVLVVHTGSSLSFPLTIPANPSLAGLVVGAQALALDAGVAAGFALSNGVILRLR